MTRILIALLITAGFAAAQHDAEAREKLKKQMEEITTLMRDSERWLLEMTRVDRVVQTQDEIIEKLKKLAPPDQQQNASPEQQAERDKKRQQLQEEQQQTVKKLEEILNGQKQSAERTVQQLQELLKNLPRQQGQGPGDSDEKKSQSQKDKERQKRLRDQNREKKQNNPASREKKDDPKSLKDQRSKQKSGSGASRMKMVEAWIARLPPEDQDRINRNDFSTIPSRYRRLVEEYTARRAKREAEKEPDTDR